MRIQLAAIEQQFSDLITSEAAYKEWRNSDISAVNLCDKHSLNETAMSLAQQVDVAYAARGVHQ